MTARTTPQAPGTPTWLDFWVADMPAARRFWTDLLDHRIPEDESHASATDADGRHAFGLGPAWPEAGGDVAVVHIATDDVDATLTRAKELGARTPMDAMDIPGHGRMGVVIDPTGAIFGLWQADGVVGYDAVDEPGFPCWQELHTTDVQRAATFYSELFGYRVEQVGPMGSLIGHLGEDGHFSLVPTAIGEDSHWVTYLLVDDLDVAIDRAVGLGAHMLGSVAEMPFGRSADLRAPGGAFFGLFASAGEDGN